MINTTYSVCKRSSYMFMNGCQESIREIALLPQVHYKAIYEMPRNIMPRNISEVIKGMSVFLISAIPCILYDPEFGRALLNCALSPIKGAYGLVLDPIHMLPIAAKELVIITAFAVGSLAVGTILGITIIIPITGIYGFCKGIVNGYYKNLGEN